LGESKVEVREFPDPKPGPRQAVLEMKVAGLCGSDLHKYHSNREWADARHGMISGHEPAGVIVEVGPDVDELSVGDRVCVYHRTGCGNCADCRAGYAAFCEVGGGAFGRTQDGSHADFMLTDAHYCLLLPDEISFSVGTQLACTAGTAFSALTKLPARAGDAILVFGLGPVGLAGLLLGVGKGYRAIGVDVEPYRIGLAKAIGGGTVIDARNEDVLEKVRDLTDGKGVAGVLECSGSSVARKQATGVAGRGATVVFVGHGSPEIPIEIGELLRNDLTVKGNVVFSMASYHEAVNLLLRKAVPLDRMVTHRFKIEQAVEAFALFDTGKTGKVVFDWDA